MPANPIQRKTRNSFLLGMLIMLMIAIIILAILYFTVFKDTIDNVTTKETQGTILVFRTIAEVKSGEKFELNTNIEQTKMYASDLPSDYISDPNIVNFNSKIDLKPGTVLTLSLICDENTQISNSTRLMEYNMLTLPSTLSIGDFVDVRFMMPSGENYIVLSKKQVKDIQESTISLYLTEDEILMMSSAIIESYIMKASDLYVTQYVQAGTQTAIEPTYSVNEAVLQIIRKDPNYQTNYKKMLDSYNETLRASIQNEINKYDETKITNIEEKIAEQKEKAMELYLGGLSGY